jgi:hypothetical protein
MGERKSPYRVLVGKHEAKRPSRRRSGDNIKKDKYKFIP